MPVVDFPTRQCQKWQKNVEWRHVSPQSHTSLTSSYTFDVRYKATGHVTPFQIDMNEFQRLHTEQTNIQTEQMNIKKKIRQSNFLLSFTCKQRVSEFSQMRDAIDNSTAFRLMPTRKPLQHFVWLSYIYNICVAIASPAARQTTNVNLKWCVPFGNVSFISGGPHTTHRLAHEWCGAQYSQRDIISHGENNIANAFSWKSTSGSVQNV